MQSGDPETVDAAVDLLKRRLPPTWVVEKRTARDELDDVDLVITTPAGTRATLFVEVKIGVSPRDVEALMGGPWRRWRRQTANQPLLLVSPYLAPRVRELLAQEGVSYLDLTGNIRITLDPPEVFIETQGAHRDPEATTPRTALRGAKAGAVVRELVDAVPPYTAAEVARAANVDQGYLTRILDTLVGEGLIDRERAGPVTRVDWPALLRRRAEAVDLFGSARAVRGLARRGIPELLDRLRARPASRWRLPTVTGSVAAASLVPVDEPELLVLYAMNPPELASELDLTGEGEGDTIIIRPDNEVVFSRGRRDGGVAWAAPSQIAIDCLSVTGRMHSEGDALIAWMRENEDRWR
jgi:hypothetical protein